MDMLVSTEWLAEHLGEPNLVILDASLHLPGAGRNPGAEFVESHIPGARFLDLASFVDSDSPVPAALPGRGQFAARMASLGVTPGVDIVLYDDSMLRSACRAWFILRHYGMQEVAVLDGGMAKWRAEGRPVENSIFQADPTNFALAVEHSGNVRDKAAMLANCASGAEQVVDARDPGRFTGEAQDTVHNLPGGHIPGARNLFFRDLLEDDGTFRESTELAAAFANAGIDPARPLVASCGSGVTASVVLFAHALLGHSHGALYDGSWSEWGADSATPKETGPAR